MIRGTKRELNQRPSVVNVDLNASIHNRFDIEVVDAKTGKVKQKAKAFNVVCDNLWKRLFTLPSTSVINDWSEYLVYGTGSGTPSAADVSLFSYLGNKNVFSGSVNNYDPETGVLSTTKKAQILESEHVGATITEVGLAYSSSNGCLCTHAMLQDMNGNQISILKTGTDIINLYSTVFVHMEPAKKNGIQLLPVLINKNGHWNQMHVASILSGVAFSITYTDYARFFATPNVYSDKDITVGDPPMYANPSEKTWTFGPIRLPAASGNIGGLYGVGFALRTNYNYNSYPVPFVALFPGDGGWFPGSNVVGEAVGTGDGTTTEFALKFPYATEGKVYVDGVEASGVTVARCPTNAKAGYILQLIHPESTLDNIIPYVSNGLTVVDVRDNMVGNNTITTGSVLYFYNPMWEAGLDHFNLYYTLNDYLKSLEFSDDLVHWEEMSFSKNIYNNTNLQIPEELKHKKFIRIAADSTLVFNNYDSGIFFGDNLRTKAIVFDTPPADGAIITADYHTPVIAKDENHVFDVSVTIHCGEYNPNA